MEEMGHAQVCLITVSAHSNQGTPVHFDIDMKGSSNVILDINGKKKVTKTTIVGGRIVRTQVDDLNPLSTTSSNIRSLQSLRNKAKQDKDNQREKNVNTLNESGQDESLKYSRDIRKGAHRLQ